MRAGVLILYTVGVERVHTAQQATQLGRHAGASQRGTQPRQVMGLGQQGLHAGIGGQQGLELVDLGVHASIFANLVRVSNGMPAPDSIAVQSLRF